MTNKEKIKKIQAVIDHPGRKKLIIVCLKIWVTLRVTMRIT